MGIIEKHGNLGLYTSSTDFHILWFRFYIPPQSPASLSLTDAGLTGTVGTAGSAGPGTLGARPISTRCLDWSFTTSSRADMREELVWANSAALFAASLILLKFVLVWSACSVCLSDSSLILFFNSLIELTWLWSFLKSDSLWLATVFASCDTLVLVSPSPTASLATSSSPPTNQPFIQFTLLHTAAPTIAVTTMLGRLFVAKVPTSLLTSDLKQ